MTEPHEITKAVQGVLSRYLFIHLLAIVVCAFGLGGWAATIQYDLSRTKITVHELSLRSDERMKEWWTWRQGVDTSGYKAIYDLNHHRDRINNHEDRLKNLERKP